MFTLEMQGINTFLVYEIEEQDKKDITSLNILKNNKIDGLLSFSYAQMDRNEFFRYNITSKISLEKFLMEIVTKEQILTIWSTIINTIIELEEYMIDGATLLLDLDKIYINVSTYKPEMICMPLMGKQNSGQEEFFKGLIYKMRYSQNEDTSYVIKLIEYFNGSQPFSLIDLKGLLETLNERNYSIAPNKAVVKDSVGYEKSGFVKKKEYDVEIKQVLSEELNNQFESELYSPKASPDSKFQNVASVSEKPENQVKEKRGLFGRKKNKAPKEKKIKAEKSKNNNKEQKGKQAASNIKMAVPGQAEPINEYFLKNQKPIDSKEKKTEPVLENQYYESQTSTHGVEHYNMIEGSGFGETTVLSSDIGETTVLSQDMQGGVKGNERAAYITRKKNNDRRLINKREFKIGKEASYVDFSIGDNSNISRTHANIISENGKLYIVDNNSTNHTYVDNQIVMPGEKIELINNVHIRLADEEFEINFI